MKVSNLKGAAATITVIVIAIVVSGLVSNWMQSRKEAKELAAVTPADEN